jgi:DNA-binding transcriptional LysR family regulator
MIDYPKVYAFCEIANCLSFTEAANRLYTTQSSLSKSIASLEKALGCPLFFRSNRNVTLTPSGKFLYKYFKTALLEMQQAAAYAREISEGKRGHLDIGIYGLHGISKDVTDMFLNFYQDNPLYGFDFVPMSTKDARDLLISKKIDAVITKQQDVSFISEGDYRTLSSCKLVAIARSGHPLFERVAKPELSDLKDCDFVNIRPSFSPSAHKMVLDLFNNSGFTPIIKSTENSYYGMMMHVASSDYIGIMNESDCCNKDALRLIPIKNSPPVNTVLAWNHDNMSDPLVRLIEHLDRKYTNNMRCNLKLKKRPPA